MNPFDSKTDAERHTIWHRLVAVDNEAFVAGDWSMIESDFDAETFEGIRCYGSANPADWRVAFPTLASYRESWLKSSAEFRQKKFVGLSQLEALYARTKLTEIEICGERALCHKKFSGELNLEDGGKLSGNRQTLFRLHKRGGNWKIVGFLGYLPLEVPIR